MRNTRPQKREGDVRDAGGDDNDTGHVDRLSDDLDALVEVQSSPVFSVFGMVGI